MYIYTHTYVCRCMQVCLHTIFLSRKHVGCTCYENVPVQTGWAFLTWRAPSSTVLGPGCRWSTGHLNQTAKNLPFHIPWFKLPWLAIKWKTPLAPNQLCFNCTIHQALCIFFFHMFHNQPLVSGWWARATPLKNMKVNWDDEIPYYSQYMGK